MFKSSFYLFSSTLVLGTLLSISSSSWFGIWIGLELNLLSFIPLMGLKSSKTSAESALKYFLVQACSSLVVLQGGLILSSTSLSFMVLVMSALVLKAGGAPFHFWLPMVAEGLSWSKVALLLTLQKIAPLTLVSYCLISPVKMTFMSIIILSGVVGAYGGFNETLLRKILSFSSISHMAWMFVGMLMGGSVWFIYFLLYCLISLSLMFLLMKYQIFHMNQISLKSGSMWSELNVGFSLMSLSGLPPFLGFLPKWLIIQISLGDSQLFIIMILIGTSLITLFYYLRTMLVSFSLMKLLKSTNILNFKLSKMEYFILALNSAGLAISGFIWSLSL
uniref:NADH-ubiquinone oxidoreductase chain 2 n=1 Tax=Glyptonotus cf. antarcticus FK-2009 TaxID=692432 RepID=E3SX96_9CRUS|nr:NADH dehydrogenase subunit 2 [Glyptonotus cf. antarcticus FK-2009]